MSKKHILPTQFSDVSNKPYVVIDMSIVSKDEYNKNLFT